MSPEIKMALVVALPPTLATIGGIIIAWIGRNRTHKSLDHITVLTNSNLSEANKKIDRLEGLVSRLVEEKDNLKNKKS